SAKRLEVREGRVAEDVDAVALDPQRDDLERALEDPRAQLDGAEALGLLEPLGSALDERASVVVSDPLADELHLMDRTDDVMESVVCPARERRRDPEVIFDPHAQ